MGRHRKTGRQSGSVSELCDRINAARQVDPDRTSLSTGAATPTELRRSLRADAALRRSIAEGVAQRSTTPPSTTPRPAGGARRPAAAAPRGPVRPPENLPAPAAAAIRRRNSLDALARSTRPAADPWSDHLERTYALRRAERDAGVPTMPTPALRATDRVSSAATDRAISSAATDRAIASALRTLSTSDTAVEPVTGAETVESADTPIGPEDRRGRHRTRPLAAIRRHSTLTLASLIPTGLIGIAGATASTGTATLVSAHAVDPAEAAEAGAQAAEVPQTDNRAPAGENSEAPAGASTGAPAGAASTDAPAGSFVAAAEVAVPVASPVVSQTAPGAAGGPALRNLPDLPTSLKTSPLGVPPINLATYVRAERITADRDPGCNMSWQLLAGIGRVESSHANDGKVDGEGNLLEPIYGLPLDGSLPGSKVIRDTDGGEYDGDPVYDRAVGPMQFIPQTWKKYATDGTGDGKADPQNLFDAAATTAAYLCDGGLDMRDPAQATRAIMRYNNSRAYASNVVAWSTAYATGVSPRPEDLPKIH